MMLEALKITTMQIVKVLIIFKKMTTLRQEGKAGEEMRGNHGTK